MCRLFAFISPNPILLDDVLVRPEHAITKQIVAEFQGVQFVNADGFGISWYTEARSKFFPKSDQPGTQLKEPLNNTLAHIRDGPLLPFVRGPRPAIYKTTIAKPLNDPSFISLCANVSSKCIFAHVRDATSPPVATTNNHPFVFGRHCFMQNGFITEFDKIRKEMLSHVHDGFSAMIEGGTDTEHFAAIYMTRLCDPKDFLDAVLDADKHYSAASMWEALKYSIQIVEEIQKRRGLTCDNFFNIGATDGHSFVGLCYRTIVSPESPPASLWLSVTVADLLNRKPYYLKKGTLFEDISRDIEVVPVARDIRRNAKPCIRRDPNHPGAIDIEPELLKLLDEERHFFPGKHGPHIIVASEPTVLNTEGWFELRNRDVILVDTVPYEDGRSVLNLIPETYTG